MKSPRLADVGVVTVSYHSAQVLTEFIRSAKASSVKPSHIVVVDNASPDVSVRTLVKKAGATYLPMTKNVGYGSAINAGVASLPAEITHIIIANPDVSMSPTTVTALLDGLTHDERIGAVGPRVRNPDGTIYPSARQLPSLRNGVGHALFVKVWPGNPWTKRYRHDDAATDIARTAGWLSGAFILMPRQIFEELDGFDEAYFMYFEDVDLGNRLAQHGYSCFYWPEAEVVHSGAHSTSHSAEMLNAHHHSAYRFLSKKYSGWYRAPLRWILKAGLAVRYRALAAREPAQ